MIPDGEMKSFGKNNALVSEVIDKDDLDDQQFTIRNYDGILFIICQSGEEYPTRI